MPDNESNNKDGDGWIDTVVEILGAFGANKVRVRWKLMRWKNAMENSGRSAENRMRTVKYEHKTCPSCGSVADRDATKCSRCGSPLRGRGWHVAEKMGLMTPRFLSASALIGLLCIVVYARMYPEDPKGFLGGYNLETLLRFGGDYPRAVFHGQFWRLVTACFLHIGLWHIGFNLFALSQVGPAIETLYGKSRMLFFFLLTGAVGNLVAELFGFFSVSAGASGGLLGLIGVAAGWGQKQGTSHGKTIRNTMMKWFIYTMVFGFFIGANNWAHGGGFASGALLGYFLSPRFWEKPSLSPLRVTVSFINIVVLAGSAFIILWPYPGDAPMEHIAMSSMPVDYDYKEVFEPTKRACKLYAEGRVDEAVSAAKAIPIGDDPGDEPFTLDAKTLKDFCAGLEEMRGSCEKDLKEGFVSFRSRISQNTPLEYVEMIVENQRAYCEALLEPSN